MTNKKPRYTALLKRLVENNSYYTRTNKDIIQRFCDYNVIAFKITHYIFVITNIETQEKTFCLVIKTKEFNITTMKVEYYKKI